MFAAIKNGLICKKLSIKIPKKNICESFLKILWTEGYILGYSIDKKNNQIKIYFKYTSDRPAINSINLISKPGRKIYYSLKQIWKIDSNKVFIIFSTNQGLKSIVDCKKLKIGGEPILVIN